MRGGSLLLFFCSCFIFSLPLRSDRGRFSRLLFFSSLSLLLFVFLDVAMVWKGKPASVTTGSRDGLMCGNNNVSTGHLFYVQYSSLNGASFAFV